jgi:uncharacterized damage-inducible protein DinB
MAANPYERYLGDQDPIDVIATTPLKLTLLIEKAKEESLNTPPAAGKWSIRHILCHLADTEIAFAFRIRQALAEPHHVVQPFDQDKWSRHYDHFSAADALEAFTSLRHWNVLTIQAAGSEARQKRLTHPERGEMTFQTLIETMGGHDVNHIRQIEAIKQPALATHP